MRNHLVREPPLMMRFEFIMLVAGCSVALAAVLIQFAGIG